MKFFVLFSLFTAFLISACGPETPLDRSQTPSSENPHAQQLIRFEQAIKPTFVDWHQVEAYKTHMQFECPDCPLSMAKLVTTTIDDSKPKPVRITGNCFGGLLDENRFLTSRHCLPEDLQFSGKNCRHRIKVVFPSLGDSSQSLIGNCKKILEVSPVVDGLEEDEPQPDWAIIELQDSYPTRFKELENLPLPAETNLKLILPLQENPDPLKENLAQIDCTTQMGTLAFPDYKSENSSVVLLECNHDITKGFSGSLLYQQTDEGLRPVATLSHIYDTNVNKDSLLVSRQIIASSLKCLPGATPNHDDCEFDHNKRNLLKQDLVIAALEKESPKIFKKLEKFMQDDQPIIWEKISFEMVEKSELTKHLMEHWDEIQALDSDIMQEAGKKKFFEVATQIYPKCLNKDFVPDPATVKQTFTLVPVIGLKVQRAKDQRVKIHYQVYPASVEIDIIKDQPDRFKIINQSQASPQGPKDGSIMSSLFSHAKGSIPICP